MNEEITISKKQLWKYSTFMLFTIAVVGGFFMFTSGNSSITGNVVAVGGPGETVEVRTVIQNFKYSPDVITVKEGSKVKLTIVNKDNVIHGLHLPQFGIVDSQPALNTKTFEFIAKETAANGQALPTCSQEHGEVLTFNVV